MTVQLSKQELRQAGINPDAWSGLQYRERRWIAAVILRKRMTARDQFNAKMIEMQNPNFNDFVLVGL